MAGSSCRQARLQTVSISSKYHSLFTGRHQYIQVSGTVTSFRFLLQPVSHRNRTRRCISNESDSVRSTTNAYTPSECRLLHPPPAYLLVAVEMPVFLSRRG